MSYAEISPTDYTVLYPNSPTYAGAYGWTRSYMPNWAENGRRAGPRSLGETEEERAAGMRLAAEAAQRAAQSAAASNAITGSASQTVTIENAQIQDSQEVVAARAAATGSSKLPVISVVLAAATGIGIIGFALASRKRHV